MACNDFPNSPVLDQIYDTGTQKYRWDGFKWVPEVPFAGQVDSVVGGTDITVNSSDPVNPIVNFTGDVGGQVDSVVAGTNITVDDTDPANPIVSSVGGGGNVDDGTANFESLRWDTGSGKWVPNATLVINSIAGRVAIAGADVEQALNVDGNVRVEGQTQVAAGNSGAPGHSFDIDSDTGMYRPGANVLAFSTGSTERMRISSSGTVTFGNGNDVEIYPDVGGDASFIRARNNSSNVNRNLQLNATTFTFSTSEDNSLPLLTLTNNNEVRGLFKGPVVSNPDTAFRVQTSPAADPDPNIIYFIVS